MLNAHFKPLTEWAGPRSQNRKVSSFRARWVQTLDLLEYELDKLKASDIVIQIEDPEARKCIRNDGTIRLSVSDRYTPAAPGVVLTFTSPKGNISMPCDRFNDWRDNLRAIALALEALRAVDRYGVTRGNEQYRGWAQIEAPRPALGREQAIELLTSLAGFDVSQRSRAGIAEICRQLRIHFHPDRAQGDDPNQQRHRHEMFVRVGEAEAVLCPPAAAESGQ